MQTWHSNGKLLLTGEYLVLDGAKALALPVNKGQSLRVEEISHTDRKILRWKALIPQGTWFESVYSLPDLSILSRSNEPAAKKLQTLLRACRNWNTEFLKADKSFQVTTVLDFPPDYGWGSSSTLVSNLASWADVDPFVLQRSVLGGSAYDIACTRNNHPLFYQLQNGHPVVEPAHFQPAFGDRLYFLHLENKQNTEESILDFRKTGRYNDSLIRKISEITETLTETKTLHEFETLLEEHEHLMAEVLNQQPVKQKLFADYPGTIKSLGAWGGDFVLITRRGSEEEMKNYLSQKGYSTLFSWDSLLIL
ncbi:MAG: hypothetical protein JXR71_08455 [Bacteroidales bacterium]|nr:hypothetical protein [Bacteroidales bacterium]